MEEQRASLLHTAITYNKPWIVIRILSEHPQLITHRPTDQSILMMAVARKSSVELIKKLIQLMPQEGLAMTDNAGNTVLHIVESTQLATLLLTKCPNLLFVRNNSGHTPLMTAIMKKRSFEYIAKIIIMTPDDGLSLFDNLGNTVLHMVATIGNVELSELLLRKCPSLLLAHNNLKETPLMVAVKGRSSSDLMKLLIQFTVSNDLAMQDNLENTVLHMAAMTGDIELAKLLLMKCPTLLLIRNNSQYLPIHLAVIQGHSDMQEYLLSVAEQQGYDDPYADVTSEDILHSAIRARMNDVAVALSYNNPLLASSLLREEENIAAMEHEEFMLFKAIRDGSQEEVKSILLRHPELTTTCLRRSGETLILSAIKKRYSFDTIKIIIQHTPDVALAHRDIDGYTALHCIATLGSTQLATLLASKNPSLLRIRTDKGLLPINCSILSNHNDLTNYLFKKAIEEGYHDPFDGAADPNILAILLTDGMHDLAYWIDQKYPDLATNHFYIPMILATNPSTLRALQPFGYWKGHPPNENRLGQQRNRVILQMQRELKWFKELENLILPVNSMQFNEEHKTPLTVFNEKHKDLVAKEIQWMTSMASASSVVASIIATVAFAAAITVPGGNNSNGMPTFSNRKSFMVFAVSDALALFTSINCVLSFLAIFTSRYGVNDFLYALPNRLIIGLISLFISALSLMVAFGTTLFLVFGQQNYLILIPIIMFSCAPVILYCCLQLPSLLNMIKSTYGGKLLV